MSSTRIVHAVSARRRGPERPCVARRLVRGSVVLLVPAMVLVACGRAVSPAADAPETSIPAPTAPTTVSDGVCMDDNGEPFVAPVGSLEVGPESTTDATLVWTNCVGGVDFLGAVDAVLYLTTDSSVMAIDLSDGSTIWKHQSDDYWSDGESQISLVDQGLWVFAPYNTSIRLDPTTGAIVGVDEMPDADPPAGFVPIPSSVPSPRVASDTTGARQVSDDGASLWSLTVRPTGVYDEGPVIQVGDLIVVPAADNHMYAIRVAG